MRMCIKGNPPPFLVLNNSICSTLFIAPLFIKARNWKQRRCLSTEEQIKKMWHIYTVDHYSAIKNKKIMKLAGKLMELENVILSEVTQTQKDTPTSGY